MNLLPTMLLLFLLSVHGMVRGQAVSLTGTITIQNSAYETGKKVYVSDASVRAPFAKAVSSDKDGTFILNFSGVSTGAPVRVSVEKPGLEVVNRSDLEAAVLGGPSLEVIMADPERLAAVQERFYHVSTEQVMRTFEERSRRLQNEGLAVSDRIKEVNLLLADSISTLGEALEALALQREAALQQVQDLARMLATVDLDRSSAEYRSAYGAMQRGAMDSVLSILSAEKLERSLGSAQDQRAKGDRLVENANKSIREVFAAYRLKSDVLRLSLDLSAALTVLSRMDTIQREQPDAFSILDRALFLRAFGSMQVRMARLPAANASLDSALHLVQRTFGREHPEAVQTILEIAILREDEGRPEEAMELYREALKLRRRTEATDRSGLIEPLSGIGNVFSALGQYDSALVYTEKALMIIQETGRSGTVEEAALTNSLGYRMDYLGRYKEAYAIYQRSLAQRRRLIANGIKGVDLTVVLGNLGYVCDELGDYPQALLYHDSCLVLEERLYGRQHTATAATINNIGRVRSRMGDDEGALANYREAMDIQLALLGPDHFAVGISHNNIASKLDDLRRRDEALPHYENALRIFTHELGPDHPYVATVLANKASSLGERGAHEEALAAYRESLRIRVATHGEEHDAVAEALGGLGIQWIHLGNADSALYYLRRAQAIEAAVLGPTHADLGHTEENIGNALILAGDTTQAREHFERAISIGEQSDGKAHPSLAPRKASLAMCLLATGEEQQAEAYAHEALSIAPNVHASWILHLLAKDDAASLEYLVECMETLGTKADEGRVGRDELERALRAVAQRTGRTDLIKKYDL